MAEIPARGDRSAWDTTNYPEKHARDIDNNAPIVHVPAPTANDKTIKSDGGFWILADYGGAPGPSSGYWEPLTNGLADTPELVFADGDVIMVEVI